MRFLARMIDGLVEWAKQTASSVGRRPLHVDDIAERRATCRCLGLRRPTNGSRSLVSPCMNAPDWWSRLAPRDVL